MKIVPNDLLRQYQLHQEEYEAAALEVLRGGWYVLGRHVTQFESAFARYTGAAHCVGLASGLDALWIAFKLLGIGAGDEVIVCSGAYIACVMGITIPGAAPVFVEPDAYYNLDTSKLEAALTKKTKAVLAVHLFGQACNMDALMEFAGRHGLLVVEDCAQSHGNHWNGKTVGTFGRVGCFSFYPTKGCGAFGDAGAIVTDDAELAQKFRTFRNYGSSRQYQFDTVGTNSRLDELQAALLLAKLAFLDEMNEERRAIAARYLAGIQNPQVLLPQTRPGADHVWHQFVVRCGRRDALKAFLAEREIGSVIHYPVPPHLSRAYAHLGYREGDFPIAERYASEVLSLPMFNGMTESEQAFVVDAVNSFR